MIRRAERIFTIKIIEGRKVLWWSLKFSPTIAAEWTFLLTTTFSGKKKEGNGFLPLLPKVRRPFQIGTFVCIDSIFIFTWHLPIFPGTLLFPFKWVHTRVNDFIWRSGDIVLRSAFAKPRGLKKTRNASRNGASISALSRTPAAVPKWD